MSRRAILGSLLGAAAALACRQESAARDPLPDPLPDLSWWHRAPRATFGALGLALLEPTRLRVFDPSSGAILRERTLIAGQALTTLADGSFLALDRAPEGYRLHHLGVGVELTLEPAQLGALAGDVGALLPDPTDPRRFRLVDRDGRVVRQGSLALLAGRVALDAVLTLDRTLPGPLLACTDGSLVWHEAGQLYRVEVRTQARPQRTALARLTVVRLANGPAPGQLWVATRDGSLELIQLGAENKVIHASRWEGRIEDLDSGPDGVCLLGRAAPGGPDAARVLVSRSLVGQERGRRTVSSAGEPSVVLGPDGQVALERAGALQVFGADLRAETLSVAGP